MAASLARGSAAHWLRPWRLSRLEHPSFQCTGPHGKPASAAVSTPHPQSHPPARPTLPLFATAIQSLPPCTRQRWSSPFVYRRIPCTASRTHAHLPTHHTTILGCCCDCCIPQVLTTADARIPRLAASEHRSTSHHPRPQAAAAQHTSNDSPTDALDKMGIHHQGQHGHVLRGLDNVHQHQDVKRNPSNSGSHIRIPEHIKAAAANNNNAAATLTSVVYLTVSADFTGPTAGYTTITPTTEASATPAVTSAASSAKITPTFPSAIVSNTATTPDSPHRSIPSSVLSAMSSSTSTVPDGSNNKSVFLNPPSTATPVNAGIVGGAPVSATRAPIAKQGHGMSGGAKAGLAFGIIAALALAAGLIFFCWRRRRNENAHQEDAAGKRTSTGSLLFGGKAMSEKHASIASSTHTTATAPRLSLRPVTQFLPMLGGAAVENKSNDAPNAAVSEKPKSMWERRSQNTQDPFNDANVISEKQARPESPPANPFDEPEGDKTAPAGVVAVAAADATAAAPRGPNNVHRVQLDFKPSMDDELELKSGQLVRMLHEYDDGWVSKSRLCNSSTHTDHVLRRSASAWTAPSRVSSLALASPSFPSSLVLRARPRSKDPTAAPCPPAWPRAL